LPDMTRVLIAYPGPTHSTYDVARGYDGALRREGFDVRSFQYHNYISFYTAAIRACEERGILGGYQPEHWEPFLLASERLALHVLDTVPDVVLIIAGGALHKRAHEIIRKLNVPMILLCTESPYQDEFQAKIIAQGHVAAALTNERASVDVLHEATGVPVRYLPHSYDPTRHMPGPAVDGMRSSVFFHGTLWPERDRLLDAVRDIEGARVTGYTLDTPDSDKDIVTNDDMARFYHSADVCISHHRRMRMEPGDEIGEGDAYSLGPRAFEIAACGAFQISDFRPELAEVFGGSVPVYNSPRQLRELAEWYLAHPAERERLALEQYAAVAPCSFDNRAREIVAPLIEEVCNG